MISSDTCDGNCNTINDLSSRLSVSNKIEDVNSNVLILSQE